MNFLIPPWKHQLAAIERAANEPHFGLLFEQGTGKTSTLINILRYKFSLEKRVLRTLILCPPIVVENWRREWAKYSKVDPRYIVPLVGPQKKRVETFRAAKGNCIFVTNYESTMMKELWKAWKEAGYFEVVAADESHRCKSRKAARTKAVVELAKHSRFRYILTGTPLLNGPEDLFSQFQILDKGETFGNNFYIFLHRFFMDMNVGMPKETHFPDWQLRPGAMKEINTVIQRNTMQAKKEDCLDLPPLVRQERYVEMTAEQAKAYEQMKEDFIAFLDDEACVGDLAITRGLRLQQIVSGFMPMDNGEVHFFEGNPRLAALKELLTDLTPNHKVIVWAVFHNDYAQIRKLLEELKVGWVEVTGAVASAKQKRDNVDVFNNDPACRVFLGNQRAAGIGINLVPADISIFYSRNFSLEDDDQAESRNYRGGSEVHKKVTRIDLICAGTIDQLVLTALAAKKTISLEILRGLKGKI